MDHLRSVREGWKCAGGSESHCEVRGVKRVEKSLRLILLGFECRE